MLAFLPTAKAQNVLIPNGFYMEAKSGSSIYLEAIGDEYVAFDEKSKPRKLIIEGDYLKYCEPTYNEYGEPLMHPSFCLFFYNSQNGIKVIYSAGMPGAEDEEEIITFLKKVENGYQIKVNCCGYLVVTKDGKEPGYRYGTEGTEGCECANNEGTEQNDAEKNTPEYER